MYQTRASGFEAELTAAEGEGLSVGADVLDGSNLDPVRLENVQVACMTLINNYRKMTTKTVQRREVPNNA